MKSKRLLVLTILLAHGISGCVTPSTPLANLTHTETLPAPTALVARTQPPPKPTRTKVPIPTEIPTRTALPTPTAISALQAKDANTEIMRLLSSKDQDCLFPCWWRLIPGQTRIVDAQNYLNSFRALPGGGPEFNIDHNYISFQLPQVQDSYFMISLEFEGNHILNWLQVRIFRNVKVIQPSGEPSFEISWNDPKLKEIATPYSLTNIFSIYGQPAEVIVFTHQVALLNRPHPLSLVVFYPEHGFMVEYVASVSYEGTGPDITLKYCPSFAFPYFWFWSPSEKITLRDTVSWIQGYQLSEEWLNAGKFKPLEEATGISIEEFYTLYTTDRNACITTPAATWPMPGQ